MFILFVTLVYGLVASKSVAYCCGMCHTEVREVPVKDSICKSEGSCCHHEKTSCWGSDDSKESADHDCTKDPCRVTYVQFDWSHEFMSKSITPSLPVLDLFYENYLQRDLISQISEIEISKLQPPPLMYPSPREYLSFLNILII